MLSFIKFYKKHPELIKSIGVGVIITTGTYFNIKYLLKMNEKQSSYFERKSKNKTAPNSAT